MTEILVHLQVNIPVYFYLSAVVDCGSLEDPDNGQVNFSNTTFESTANYTCDLGYSLNGNSTRTCEVSGEWSGDQPSCQRKWWKYLCICK